MRGTHKAFLCFLLPILFVAGVLAPARAQQQEKRIALVVGNGAYAKSPLATAANDGGLIAQTLQAAGFDVVGARDLDGDTLRKSLRDFIQKAQASGPGTVAMIYLSGYGVQLAGENYFVPVDANITRDTDIPTEALRVSDYARQLAAIPLKANIIVLDAARAQPFVEGGQQPIASGLALVEPDPNMLIAFNAAPGTVAPVEPGPYGIYAQSLAEMIRTGGLSLPEVFDRVRLRVNENSKGAQVPWDDQKITAQFSFFDRAPDAPPPPAAPDQVAAVRNKPIRDLGVQDAYAAALERDTLPAYEDFLAAYPSDPLAKRVMAIVAARREAITWRRTYRTDTPEAYWSYLRRYPRGPHAGDARRRLAILTAPMEPPPTFAMIDYDVPPPPPAEVIYVDRPVLYFSDPDFDFVPPPPPPVYFCPPPPPDFVVLPPPLPVIGLFVLPQPVFVPIPVFYNPPAYVAPPPNNIIVNNIHNTTVINTVINQPAAPPVAAVTDPAITATAAASGKPVGATTAVPPTVVQKAALIQANKAPVPNTVSFDPTTKVGSAALKAKLQSATPAGNAATGTPTGAPATAAKPGAGGAPVTGTQGAPGTGGAAPATGNAVTKPGAPGAPVTATAPAAGGKVNPANTATAPTKAGTSASPPSNHALPVPGQTAPAIKGAPQTGTAAKGTSSPTASTNPVAGSGATGKPGSSSQPANAKLTPQTTPSNAPPAGGARPNVQERANTVSPANTANAPAKPGGAKPNLPSPPAQSHANVQPIEKPAQREKLAPPPTQARPTAPPPPVTHIAPPPSRPQAVARPTPPPPPRVSAPPPRIAAPPPRMAAPPPPRPAPPPVAAARPAPPPPVARPAPPPPPRMAVAPPRPPAPPPRPAAPPPAAKKCPPNQPRC